MDFSTTSAQLKWIKYKISCSDLAYTDLSIHVYQKYKRRVFLLST